MAARMVPSPDRWRRGESAESVAKRFITQTNPRAIDFTHLAFATTRLLPLDHPVMNIASSASACEWQLQFEAEKGFLRAERNLYEESQIFPISDDLPPAKPTTFVSFIHGLGWGDGLWHHFLFINFETARGKGCTGHGWIRGRTSAATLRRKMLCRCLSSSPQSCALLFLSPWWRFNVFSGDALFIFKYPIKRYSEGSDGFPLINHLPQLGKPLIVTLLLRVN